MINTLDDSFYMSQNNSLENTISEIQRLSQFSDKATDPLILSPWNACDWDGCGATLKSQL